MRKFYTFAVVLVIAFTLIACASDKKANENKVEENQQMTAAEQSGSGKAPAWTLKNSQGDDVSLADFSGKVVILDFWATWCPPCRQEIPHFIELQNEYGDQGLQVVGVSLDQQGWDVVRPFMAQQGINYPIVLLTDHNAYAAYQELLPSALRGSIPFTFILDKDGTIKDQVVGYHDKSYFEAAIKPLL